MSGIVYGSVGILSCVIVLGLWRTLSSLAARSGRITESDARGTTVSVGTVLGLLLGVGFASVPATNIDQLPLLVAVVTLLLVLKLVLVGRYYFSLRLHTTAALLLLAGLFPAVVKAGELTAGAASELASVTILVPIGISAAGYVVNQFEGFGDVGMVAVALAVLSGIAFLKGEAEALLMLLAAFAAMVPVLVYAVQQPAKVLIGDIGTFAIGALIAVAAVLGGLAIPALIIFIPYLVNLGLRIPGLSLERLIMRASGGNQRRSALTLIVTEAVFGLIAVLVCIWA